MKVKGVDALEGMRADSSLDVTDPVAVMNERPFAGAEYMTSHTGLHFELAQPGELYMASQGTGGGFCLHLVGALLVALLEPFLRFMSLSVTGHLYSGSSSPGMVAMALLA